MGSIVYQMLVSLRQLCGLLYQVGIFSDTLQATEVMWLGVLLVGFPLAFISSALENAGDGKLV
jgi:hypothetical protein